MKGTIVAAIVLALGVGAGVMAEEGMWTFDNFPKDTVASKYKVQVTDQWLTRLQQSVVRLETGCSGSFVSEEGLVLTNHHCVAECLADNSTGSRDLLASGYGAPARENELKCQGAQASVLMGTENVTDRVTRALAGVPAAGAAAARNRTLTTLETECIDAATRARAPLVCQAVTLYQGGQYWLYKYKRYE